MKIILLGPPGSGKGTIAEKIEKEFRFYSISAGELLRKEIKKNSQIGKKVKNIVRKGDLVPHNIATSLVKKAAKGKKKIIFDGFPRALAQARLIEDIKIDKVIFLKVSEKEIVKRLSGRRVCQKGIHTYHLKYLPPKKKGICDIDKSKLIQRKDDTPKVIRERFRVYHKKTEPLIKYYQKKGILKKVDGSRSPKEVYEKVKKLVK